MITSPYSKSSKPLWFSPILQKFYKMICEIIISKTICRIFLFFCQSRFVNNFMEKNKFSEPQNHQMFNSSRSFYFEKLSAHGIEDLICRNKLDIFLFEKFFFKDLDFFSSLKNQLFGRHFFPQKFNFILFFKANYLILIDY